MANVILYSRGVCFERDTRDVRMVNNAEITEKLYDRSHLRPLNYRRQLQPVVEIQLPETEKLGYDVSRLRETAAQAAA